MSFFSSAGPADSDCNGGIMRIYLSADIRDFLSAAAKMHLENHLPEFISKTLAVSMRDLAENGARRVIGNGGFGQEIAEGIRTKNDGAEVVIDHVTNDTNHLAQHVHEGGPIRPKYKKFLAIPIDKSVKGENASLHRWATHDGEPIFIRRKEDGPKGRAYLAEPRGKRGKLKFLYVLVKETKAQKPRPWWPSEQEFLELTEREIKWWLDHTMPGKI